MASRWMNFLVLRHLIPCLLCAAEHIVQPCSKDDEFRIRDVFIRSRPSDISLALTSTGVRRNITHIVNGAPAVVLDDLLLAVNDVGVHPNVGYHKLPGQQLITSIEGGNACEIPPGNESTVRASSDRTQELINNSELPIKLTFLARVDPDHPLSTRICGSQRLMNQLKHGVQLKQPYPNPDPGPNSNLALTLALKLEP